MKLSGKTSLLNRLRRIFLSPLGEKVLLAVVQGVPLGSWRARLIPNHYQYPKPSWRRVSRAGTHFELDISDLVDWAVYFSLVEKEQEKYFSLVGERATVIDVGANIGSTLLRFAAAVGTKGRVIGFEPDQISFARCRRKKRR